MTLFAAKFTEAQRAAIYELKESGLTAKDVAARCGQGVKDLPPFEVSKESAARIAREEKQALEQLSHDPLAEGDHAEAAKELTSRQITLLARAQRIEQRKLSQGKVDAAGLDKLTNAVTRLRRELLQTPAKRKPTKTEEKGGFLEGLADAA